MYPVLMLLGLWVILILYALWKSMQRPKNYPPGPLFLPLVGNAIQLRQLVAAAGAQYKALDILAKRYKTQILGLKLGRELVVIPLAMDAVKDVHLQEVFEARPKNFFVRLRTLGSSQGITFAEGKQWCEHRQFTMKQMRQMGYGRSRMERDIAHETRSLLSYLDDLQGCAICPGSYFSQSVINVLWSLIAGRRFERNDQRMVKLLSLLKRRSNLFDMSGGVLNHFPWLRFVAPNWSGYNLIRQLNKELFAFIMETINEHRATLSEENKDSDYIYAYLWNMQQEISSSNDNTTFSESQLVMTILDFFISGSYTTSTTIEFILINLVLRQDKQKQMYEEIHSNTKSVEFPYLHKKAYYPYTDAFIKETMRLYHIAPISGPRRALWDCQLDGYDIPKGTTILMGFASIFTDHDHWRDPKVFRPERFLNDEGKVINDEYFIPFGYGRRRCPGDSLAKACIFSMIVSICERFALLPSEKEDEKPSLDLVSGIMLTAKPYKIKFIRRS